MARGKWRIWVSQKAFSKSETFPFFPTRGRGRMRMSSTTLETPEGAARSQTGRHGHALGANRGGG